MNALMNATLKKVLEAACIAAATALATHVVQAAWARVNAPEPAPAKRRAARRSR